MTNTLARKEDRPTVEEVANYLSPMASEVVLLGMTEETDYEGQLMPMILNTMSSPNILIWNGEVDFLKMVAEFIMSRDPNERQEIEFVVFSNNVEEWEFLANETNQKKNSPCIGVIPFWDKIAEQILLGLGEWISRGIHPNHSIIILIEGVENVLQMTLDARQNFHYIFLKGKDRRVFAVGTAPKDANLLGLEKMFYHAEFNQESNKYEFPEGDTKVQVWIPRTGE